MSMSESSSSEDEVSVSPPSYGVTFTIGGLPLSGSTSAGSPRSPSEAAPASQPPEPEDDNRRREQEKWAMLAGQAAYKLEAYVFRQVLPEELIKPHIFPRNITDMEALIHKYGRSGEAVRLENAKEKWKQLKNKWQWTKAHTAALSVIKFAYLHISNPLEVMMRLDRNDGESLKETRRAFRKSLPTELYEAGDQIVEMMHEANLLKDESSINET
ncbi:uncharacterized protein LOC110976366 [Acanthaster planci]|uniref:Uncharacterized protein LOC110976366 n=1 Tax=Acanthaster planci TaxID=133434 RepID=A0A8B7XYB8_ACAPL|nr:uncharacterized protein LOC110976366 [Acanthaster planci]XP_022085257.1 uncharacterized protein LOC110976366 [Acanthaster planci]XP_022085258.1 uncharacterized protein LOC110976366 [Acanthaster planci]